MDKRFIKMVRSTDILPIDSDLSYSLHEVELDFGEDPTTKIIEAMKEVYNRKKILDFYYVYENGDIYYGYIVERDQTATPFILNYAGNYSEHYYEFIRFDDPRNLKVFEQTSFDFESAYQIVIEGR